jgi:hypothetical protein
MYEVIQIQRVNFERRSFARSRNEKGKLANQTRFFRKKCLGHFVNLFASQKALNGKACPVRVFIFGSTGLRVRFENRCSRRYEQTECTYSLSE